MKKLNKLFAILFAVLGVTTLKAQTDVTSTYLTNADFSSTDGWTAYVSGGYRDYGKLNIGGKLASYASSTSDATHLNTEYCLGFQCRWSSNYASYNQETLELPAGVYTLSYDVENVNGSTSAVNYNNLFYVKVGDKTFTDTSVEWMKGKSSWTSHSITFVITEATKAIVSLGYGTGSNNLASGNTPVLYVSHLKLTHRNIDDISAEVPADLTSYIVNNSFENGNLDGWTVGGYSSDTGVKPNSNGTYTTSGVDGNYLYNTWWQGTPLTQTVGNIPNGIYELKVLLASDQNAKLFLLANDEHSEVYTITTDNKTFHDVSYEFKVLNGQAKIGVVGGNDAGEYLVNGHWWYKADNFRLTYKGVDLSIIKEAYETALANATAARDNVEYESVTGLEKTNLLNAISLQPAENKSELEAATTVLLNATTAFTASKSDYDALATEKEIAAGLGMSEESIASAAATTKTGLVALQDLKVAEYNYIQGTYTENATLGSWTEDFASDLDGEGYKAGGPKYLDDWQGNKTTRTTKQTVTLPAGDYALSVIARGQAGASGKLYYKIGDVTTDVALIMKGNRGRGVDVNGVANFSEEGEYNCNGEGFGWEYRFITFRLDTETQVEIGASVTIQGQWASVYAPVLLTTEASVKALRMTEIANLLSTVPAGKMNATVQSTLNEKKGAAEAVSVEGNTIDELENVTTELNEAIIAAKTSIAEYEKIATYIAKANTIDGSIAADVQTQYDNGALDKAELVFQALEVATYNYVKDEFSYPVELPEGNWIAEGPTGSKSEQHWSGENRSYLEQSSAAWGQNAWSISYKQTKTLPAGDYVFKVSGRRAAGTGNTLSLVVTNINDPENPVELGMVNDFPEGDTGLGINKNGETSFKADDEAGFANNNAGRGWQWRYVKFTLTSETAVQVAVEAEATTNHQWISFCDATLQMTEETYLEANKGGLDAPTAAAEALVDTKPMGTAENDALKAALALPVTTGAELKAKIEALNTAVANANAWIPKYNEAKAPLVAALERFETDYNDAENGAIDHMNKERWTTAVNMAQAAAVAKDVTDSYEGFATATENLVAALDAATVSVGEYADLKKAIDEATPYLGGDDWGSEPFQKPESAKDDFNAIKTTAQNAYDAAEVDGEGVTAVIESLSTAVNDVVLNAPEEGQRFYIKVATEGHAKEGNAILATLGATSNNNPTGYGLNTNNVAKGYLAQAFIFTQVEENLYNISIERPEGTVYLTYGSLNGSAAGWKNQQIQATTDAEKKGDFKIVPTGKNGILKIFNTVDNNYLDCQDGGSIYTDTDISNEEFAFELATEHEVTLNISSAGWATLILPFNAEIPEGVTVYASERVEGELVKLTEVGSIVANTPYLIKGTGEYTFSGYGLADKDEYKDGKGLFVGTYVDYTTVGGEYVLQKHGDVVAFYCVGESAKPTVKAYRCYLTASAREIKAFFFGDEVTGINGVDAADTEIEAIYTINGTRVNNMQKGLNIVKMSNGKTQKVYVK
ncbi:MAG: hypothetical protein IJZ68_01775 [Bacteroidaceae bacterium]|nr:hypothetical protein [Bacteroidaceae bacterium]